MKNIDRLRFNNFDLVRFVLACTVYFAHASDLSGYQALQFIPEILSSTVAVQSFFVISGFLIFMSYERSSSLHSYFEKRVRRIYPAYFSIIILCSITFILISDSSVRDYFSLDWIKYLISNLLFMNFMHPSLPGVFSHNKFSAVNGALWTLKIEVMFYVFVPLLAFFIEKSNKVIVFFIVYVLSYIFYYITTNIDSGAHAQLAKQFPAQLTYFISGAFVYYNFDFYIRHIKKLIPLAIVFIAVSILWNINFFYPLALGIIVIFVSVYFYMGDFGRRGDFSYGVYILHYPILQILISYGFLRSEPYLFLVLTFLGVILASVLMWHLVEKRFLLRGNHYVQP